MQINFDQKLKTLDGEEIKTGEDKVLTLRDVSTNSLMALGQNDKVSNEEKLKRYSLAMKIHNAQEALDLKTEEIALIKKLIGDTYATLVFGQCAEMLEKQ